MNDFRSIYFHGILPALLWIVMAGAITPSVLNAQSVENEGKCDIQNTSCTKSIPGCIVKLDINPKPVKAMTDLDFTVILSGKIPTSLPYIDLGMPGMEMGPNRVQLIKISKNTYKGNGIIVRCPSGRRTWKAVVTLPDVGVAEFIFDVIY